MRTNPEFVRNGMKYARFFVVALVDPAAAFIFPQTYQR
jgi:hypothetical protein